MVTADTWNGSGPPGLRPMYRLFSFHQKTKTKQKKNIKNETSLRRGTRRARPKYGQSALHLSSGREINKHWVECTKPSTQLGSPSLGRLREVRILTRDSDCNICFLSILYTVPFDFCDPTCPMTAVKCLFLETRSSSWKRRLLEVNDLWW